MHLLRVVEGCGLEEFALKARPPNLTTILYDSFISNGTEELVCGKDIAAEYECTPVECYCWTLPSVKTMPEELYLFQTQSNSH